MKIAQLLNVLLQIIVLLLHFLYLSDHLRSLLRIKVVLGHVLSPLTSMLMRSFLILLEANGPLLIFNALNPSQSVGFVFVSDAEFASTVGLLSEFGFGGFGDGETCSVVVAARAQCVTLCGGCRIDYDLLQAASRYA